MVVLIDNNINTVYENYYQSTSFPTFIILSLLHFSHSDRCALVWYCNFNLRFPNNFYDWIQFHLASWIGCLWNGCSFFNTFSLLIYQFSSHWFVGILDKSPLIVTYVANIFSHYMVSIFTQWLHLINKFSIFL